MGLVQHLPLWFARRSSSLSELENRFPGGFRHPDLLFPGQGPQIPLKGGMRCKETFDLPRQDFPSGSHPFRQIRIYSSTTEAYHFS